LRRAKIACTIGPSSRDRAVIEKMILAGMDVARINMSHGSHESHAEAILDIRSICARIGREVAVLLDLSGPKIRLGEFLAPVLLHSGEEVTLTTENVKGEKGLLPVGYPLLTSELKEGDSLSLIDGLIQLRVLGVGVKELRALVLHGGTVSSFKGVNLPTGGEGFPALTKKDVADLRFGLREGVDWVSMSFVRSPHDADDARKIMDEEKSEARLMAKIEKRQALDHLDEIVEKYDGIMVARGDLGVEVPLEELPGHQKRIIRKANLAAKPVITATQMLLSMVANPTPTRAEVTDVANAIADGTDAVMLSEETAVGADPVKAVEVMAAIADKADELGGFRERRQVFAGFSAKPAEAIARASYTVAIETGAKVIITPTTSGSTARLISATRPSSPILALSTLPQTVRALALSWGVTPVLTPEPADTDALFEQCRAKALETGIAAEGELAVVTAGLPLNEAGSTNLLKILKL
jgi:pyruvate kinase